MKPSSWYGRRDVCGSSPVMVAARATASSNCSTMLSSRLSPPPSVLPAVYGSGGW